MTRALDAAMAKLSALPAEEQDRIAQWLLEELRDDEHWTRRFAGSQDALSKLAAEARADPRRRQNRRSRPRQAVRSRATPPFLGGAGHAVKGRHPEKSAARPMRAWADFPASAVHALPPASGTLVPGAEDLR